MPKANHNPENDDNAGPDYPREGCDCLYCVGRRANVNYETVQGEVLGLGGLPGMMIDIVTRDIFAERLKASLSSFLIFCVGADQGMRIHDDGKGYAVIDLPGGSSPHETGVSMKEVRRVMESQKPGAVTPPWELLELLADKAPALKGRIVGMKMFDEKMREFGEMSPEQQQAADVPDLEDYISGPEKGDQDNV